MTMCPLLLVLFACLVPCELKIASLRMNTVRNEMDPVETIELADRYGRLLSYSKSEPLITLNSIEEFIEYIVQTPRNYSTILLFNDLQEHLNCKACSFAHRNLKWVSKTYSRHLQENQGQAVFFVEILYEFMQPIFEKLQVTDIPTIFHVPQQGKLSNIQRMDTKQYPLTNVPRVVQWIDNVAGIEVSKFVTPDQGQGFNVPRLVFWVAITMIMVYALGTRNWSWDSLHGKFNTDYLAYLGLSLAIILVSGHVYNIVVSPRFSISTHDGGIWYIYPSRRIQLQAEAFIVSFIYFAFAVGFIFVVEGRRIQFQHRGKIRGNTFSAIGTAVCAFSYVILLVVAYRKMAH